MSDWSTLIVGKISPHIDLDHEDKILRQESEKMLEQELSFAGHLGLPAVMVPLRKKNTNFARVLHNKVLAVPSNQVNTLLHVLYLKRLKLTLQKTGQVSCLAAPAYDFLEK